MYTLLLNEKMKMVDIDEAYKAIETSNLLSKSQKNILKYIVSFNLQRGVTATDIIEFMNISKQAVNFSLQQLIKRNFITRYRDKVFIYKINKDKLSELLEDYQNKKHLKIN